MIRRDLLPGEADHLAASCVAFDPYLTLGYKAETLAAYLTRSDPALYRFGIESDGILMGVLCLRRPWLRGPLIEMLALLPEHCGRGLGTAVIEQCKAEAGRNLWATASDFHHRARRFYIRQGFAELCPLPGLVASDGSEILLRWISPA